jgi:hypothetical protein
MVPLSHNHADYAERAWSLRSYGASCYYLDGSRKLERIAKLLRISYTESWFRA